MAEISGYVDGPYEGVSQAPPQVRLPGSCEDMQDCYPAIPNGVQKRPPFEFKAQLKRFDGTAIPIDTFAVFHDVPRGDLASDMTLLLNREAGHIKAYLFQTATWAPIAVTIDTAAQTYLDTNTPAPQTNLRLCTVEDTTFITNRTVPTANAGGTVAGRPFEAVIWCKTHGYARKTVVQVISTAIGGGSLTASFSSGTGSNSNDPLTVGTDKLAAALFAGIDPHPGNDTPNPNPLSGLTGSGFTMAQSGSVIYLSHATVDFSLVVSDDVGGSGVVAIKGSVQRFSDLPALASDQFVVRVAQEAAGGNSDYYVQFVANSTNTAGVWKEVLAPGAPVGVDTTTLPVGLVFTGGAWKITSLAWKQRQTGNATLSPDPEFIGSTVNDVGWWKGRLVLVSNGQVNLSASDDPFKFYTTTLITSVDSDPIGLLTPVDIKTFFKEAVIFDGRLLALGNRGQAVISTLAGKTPTPSATAIDPLSKGEFTDQVAVQGANHKIYFAAPRGLYLSVFEVAIDRLSGLALPEDMTPAVPRYLPSTIDRAATFESDYVSLYGSSGGAAMFLHIFRHAEQQRVQNSWSKWNLPPGYLLCGLYIKNSVVYAALKDPTSGAGYAVQMDLAQLHVDPSSLTVLTYADMKVSNADLAAPTYDGALNRTSFVLPYTVGSSPSFGASARFPGSGVFAEGYVPPVVSTGSTTVVLQGDWRGVPLYFGFKSSSFYIPTRIYKRGQDGKPERTGRLNINRIKLDLHRASYLRAEVTVKGRDPWEYIFNGFASDDAFSHLDEPADQQPVIFNVPVGGKSEDVLLKLVNDSFLGFALTGMEWEGVWNPKAQRVT